MLELKISTLIIEKDKEALNKTFSVLKEFNELSIVAKATSAKQALTLGSTLVPQLIFINVDLPDINGLEFIRMLRKRNIFPYVVFISENINDAFDALELEPFDYLLQPLDFDLIKNMLVRLKQNLTKDELMRKMDSYVKMQTVEPKRVFHQRKGIIILRLEEIISCKAKLTSTSIKLRSGESIVVKSKIGETFEIINHSDFIRTGRSYFINRTYLRKIDKKKLKCMLYFDGKTWDVPVSKNTVSMLEKLNVDPIY